MQLQRNGLHNVICPEHFVKRLLLPTLQFSISFLEPERDLVFQIQAFYRSGKIRRPKVGLLAVCVCVLVVQSCPTHCDPQAVAYQAPPSLGFFQARVLEWVAILFSGPRLSTGLKEKALSPDREGRGGVQGGFLPGERNFFVAHRVSRGCQLCPGRGKHSGVQSEDCACVVRGVKRLQIPGTSAEWWAWGRKLCCLG